MTRTPMTGIIHCGTSYHLRTLADPRVADRVDRELYLPRLTSAALAGLDVLVVCDRVHPGLLQRHADELLDVARRGGTLVVLGEVHAEHWIPGLRWEPRPTNFWWWRTGEDPGIRPRSPEHPLWRSLEHRDVTWHFHGLLHPPSGVTVLAAVEENGRDSGSILYEDRVTTRGRLVVTTMDPTYHHGSNFMPAATRLLHGVLDWVTQPGDP
ncbi:MAG: hypothetical protein M3217_10015 [Actinomycetota bacterium]|nr:hypothetical protein [Actinomycetota bacterium]